MKELTTEQKAQLYDKAIAYARLLLKTIGNATLGNLVLKNEFENMFPELKKNEDEKVKKAISDILLIDSDEIREILDSNGLYMQDIDAWLEKQGEPIKDTDTVDSNENGLIADTIKYKNEPKFHEGDWVVCKNGSHRVFQVIKRSWPNAKYLDEKGAGGFLNVATLDKQYRPWTIQDAKDGDVLAAHECLVLFKEIDGLNIKCYCTYHNMGSNPSFYVNTLQNKTAFYPATKEQRDILFQKMHEAGYEWDVEKLELKKVEQKPAEWSEEDELNIKELLYLVKTNYLSSVKPHDRLISFLESLKDRVQLQDRIDIEVWVTKNKQWILKLNGKVVRGQWGDEPQCIYKQFFYLSEIESLKE